MKRAAVATALIVLIILTLLLFSKQYRTEGLTVAELQLKQQDSAMLPPEDCSPIQRAIASESSGTASRKSIIGPTSLSADQIAVYRALLAGWASGDRIRLNVAAKTVPLDLTAHGGISDCACLKGIDVESLSAASHSFHQLSQDVLPQKNMRLVGPEMASAMIEFNDPNAAMRRGASVDDAVERAFRTGVFSVSEIAFDKGHRRAVVSYSFWCGALCGHGATVVFEKVYGEWKKSELMCGGFVS